jgi:hypothetical protein
MGNEERDNIEFKGWEDGRFSGLGRMRRHYREQVREKCPQISRQFEANPAN